MAGWWSIEVTDAQWEAFRTLPLVQAALDAVPEPAQAGAL
jgi:hypothetical protein